jgi:ABC-type branched-subunit amino acid transport system substrate-binding protein
MLAGMAALACGRSAWAQSPDGQIVLGQTTALSGPLADLGQALYYGAQMAFAAVNARGGIHGRTITLNTLDDGYEVDKAVSNARQLLADPATFALFNCFGTPHVAAMLPLAQSSNVPFFAPLTGAQVSRVAQRNVFNIRASYAEEAEKIIQHLATLGMRRIAIVYQANSFGKEVLDATQRAMAVWKLRDEGATATVQNDGRDAQVAATKLADSEPEAVIIGLAGKPTLDFVKAFRSQRRGTPLYALSVMGAAATLQALGRDAAGMAITQVVPQPTNPAVPIVREFMQAWKNANMAQEPSHSALEGYIIARTFCEALQRAGKNPSRAAFIDATWSLKKWDMGGFEINATEPGQNASRFVELTLVGRDGRFMR